MRSLRTLLVMLGIAAAVTTSTRVRAEGQVLALSPQNLKFIQIPDMPDCATAAILRGDPRTGPSWVLLRLASGCRVPWHWHTPTEEMVVISGRGRMTMQNGPWLDFVPGAYASLPTHHIHQASCTHSCLFFSSSDGPFDIHYVDAKGGEISLDEAMKQPAKPTRTRRTKK